MLSNHCPIPAFEGGRGFFGMTVPSRAVAGNFRQWFSRSRDFSVYPLFQTSVASGLSLQAMNSAPASWVGRTCPC